MNVDDSLARLALAHFHLGPGIPSLQALGGHGGFSGARLWRCEVGDDAYCLRVWSADMTEARISTIHTLMESARSRGRLFVPELITTHDLQTWLVMGGRIWELASWMPGKADFRNHPTPQRLRAACRGLALLHQNWIAYNAPKAPCPAVIRRLETLQRWQSLVDSRWLPLFGTGLLAQVARRAWELVRCWTPHIKGWLEPCLDDLPQQWCLCDVWHDHLLFEGDKLTGLVDYGEVKLDHFAVDLARMLGSLAGDDEQRWEQGLRTYRVERDLRESVVLLIRVLDRTGVILGATNWLRWLYHDGRTFDNLDAVARRLSELVQRMERWQGGLVS